MLGGPGCRYPELRSAFQTAAHKCELAAVWGPGEAEEAVACSARNGGQRGAIGADLMKRISCRECDVLPIRRPRCNGAYTIHCGPQQRLRLSADTINEIESGRSTKRGIDK